MRLPGAWGKARKVYAALGGVRSTVSWIFYLHRKVRWEYIKQTPSLSRRLAPEFIGVFKILVGVFNPRKEALGVLSIMRVGQSGRTHR